VIQTFSGRSLFLATCYSILLSFFFCAPLAAEAKGLSPSGQFVQNLGNTALMSLTSKNLSRKTREDRVRGILRDNFDIAAIGKFAMGTYWREASEAQRSEYMRLFEDMIVQTYTTRFEDYSGQTLKVDNSVRAGSDFLVNSQVIQKDGPPVGLQWRIRNKDAGMRVVDVIVEGVSMSVTQRSDFASVIQSGGGKVDALLTTLRERKNGNSNKKG
jgi:phospholipid transport system substrate-binding protein